MNGLKMHDLHRIAAQVTSDFDLNPPLRALTVQTVCDPFADSFLPPLRAYPEDQWAAIESRILQEADRA